MKSFKIFVVEDDNWYRNMLEYFLQSNPDYEVQAFDTGAKMIQALHQKPNVITLDYSLPDYNGGELLEYIKRESPDTEVIIVSGQEDVSTAINLLHEGAYDYLVKDNDTKDKVWKAILHIKEKSNLKQEIK